MYKLITTTKYVQLLPNEQKFNQDKHQKIIFSNHRWQLLDLRDTTSVYIHIHTPYQLHTHQYTVNSKDTTQAT